MCLGGCLSSKPPIRLLLEVHILKDLFGRFSEVFILKDLLLGFWEVFIMKG